MTCWGDWKAHHIARVGYVRVCHLQLKLHGNVPAGSVFRTVYRVEASGAQVTCSTAIAIVLEYIQATAAAIARTAADGFAESGSGLHGIEVRGKQQRTVALVGWAT